MKFLFFSLILTFAFSIIVAPETNAQTGSQKVTMRVGKQKRASRSRLNIRFVSLVEDSRCPTDTNCIHAGNANIKVQISKAGSDPVTFEMNTNLGAKGDVYEGYAIYLTDLTPVPSSNVRLNRNAYTATFSVSRLSR